MNPYMKIEYRELPKWLLEVDSKILNDGKLDKQNNFQPTIKDTVKRDRKFKQNWKNLKKK